MLTANGRTQSIKAWAREIGAAPSRIRDRLKQGLSPEEAVDPRRRTYKTHGASRKLPEYRVWGGMLSRCLSPKCKAFHNYGGRGIRVCEEWQGKEGFARFFAHVGPRPTPKHEIDRIDNDGNYEPGNVRWATKREQALNRRTTRLVTAFGRNQCIKSWAEETGISERTLRKRLATMSPEGAFGTGRAGAKGDG